MCNAYSLTRTREEFLGFGRDLVSQLGLWLDDSGVLVDHGPRYRTSPRQWAPIVRLNSGGHLNGAPARWGLVTKGGKPSFAPTNARDDKLVTGWPWKMLSKSQRCLVPADGFFEPEKEAGAKGTVPWSYYAMGNRQMFLMSGLWNSAPDPKTGDEVDTYTVVTTATNEAIKIHDRMPVIVDEDDALRWLQPGDVHAELLKPYPGERMVGWRVTNDAPNSWVPDHDGILGRA